MTLSAEALPLSLRVPFRIAHGASTARTNVLVRLGDGVGEAGLPPYYGITAEHVLAYLHALDLGAVLGQNPHALEAILDRLPPGPAPARAAFDIALHDHWARTLGQPLYRLWGLDPADAPASAVTLSIPDDLGDLPERLGALREYPLLKLKLGTGDPEADLDIVRAVHAQTDQAIGVDANGAWPLEVAIDLIPRMAEFHLAFIEQPLPPDDPDDWHRLDRMLFEPHPPLFADESACNAEDLLALAGAADGVNIKLAKSGGLREARRLITLARALDMQVMLGCMIESAVAVTAAAHLAPLADFVDLDASLHLAEDPFEGLWLDAGSLCLPDRPGIGVRPR